MIFKKYKTAIVIIGACVIALGIILYIKKPQNGSKTAAEINDSGYINLFQFMSFSDEVKKQEEIDVSKFAAYEMEEANMIKRVILEKNPVCANEEVLVTVVAANPHGSDANLMYRISNKPGNPAILRFRRAGPREFFVVVRDNANHIDFRKVPIAVQECERQTYVILRASLSNLKQDVVEFEVTEQKGLTGKCEYSWNFGDGLYSTTQTGSISHSYARREQTQFQTTFTVSVAVTDAEKKHGTGRATVSLPNLHYISSVMGNPTVPMIYEQFPELKNSIYELPVAMKNIYDEDITFQTADIEYKPCDSSGMTETRRIDAGVLLANTVLPRRGTVDTILSFDKSQLPPFTCNLSIRLSGRMRGVTEVVANMHISIPPSGRDSVDEGRDAVVKDDEMINKLNRAAEILGRDRPITPDDIRRLEKEGKL